jgi:hypothetical protein
MPSVPHRSRLLARFTFLCLGASAASLSAQVPTADQREHAAALGAHHICSGLFVVGRDYRRTPEEVLAQDVARFPAFLWQDDFRYTVDRERHMVTVAGQGIPPRSARYHDDQGCTILPRGEEDVYYTPVHVARDVPDAATTPWPMGDLNAVGPIPAEVDEPALDEALDWGMAQPDQNTRAIVVASRGKIIAERYAPGFTKDTPQISWSMGKSITAALIGVLVRQGHFHWTDPAPVAEWHAPRDPRGAITIAQLMRMSSGLDFKNYGLNGPESYTPANEHFLIYFGAPHVFQHAVNQPLAFPPDEEWRYKNSDPLTLGMIVRRTVEERGENYLTFPQRHLFDRIGARNYVLETDAYGNFIMTGYDFGSARGFGRYFNELVGRVLQAVRSER